MGKETEGGEGHDRPKQGNGLQNAEAVTDCGATHQSEDTTPDMVFEQVQLPGTVIVETQRNQERRKVKVPERFGEWITM